MIQLYFTIILPYVHVSHIRLPQNHKKKQNIIRIRIKNKYYNLMLIYTSISKWEVILDFIVKNYLYP